MAAGREISGLMALALVAFRGTERHEEKARKGTDKKSPDQ